MAKIIIYLGKQERDALEQLAQRERRIPRAQAAHIVRQELLRQGLLAEQTHSPESAMQVSTHGGEA